MSEPERSVISPENIPTVVAVAAVSALLAFAFSIFVYRELKSVTIGAVSLDVRAARRDVELQREIQALEARLTALEPTPAAPNPAAPNPAAPNPAAPTADATANGVVPADDAAPAGNSATRGAATEPAQPAH